MNRCDVDEMINLGMLASPMPHRRTEVERLPKTDIVGGNQLAYLEIVIRVNILLILEMDKTFSAFRDVEGASPK